MTVWNLNKILERFTVQFLILPLDTHTFSTHPKFQAILNYVLFYRLPPFNYLENLFQNTSKSQGFRSTDKIGLISRSGLSVAFNLSDNGQGLSLYPNRPTA